MMGAFVWNRNVQNLHIAQLLPFLQQLKDRLRSTVAFFATVQFVQ